MLKTFYLLILAVLFSATSFALGPLVVEGEPGMCVGGISYVYESDTLLVGGVWSSSNIAIATVVAVPGLAMGKVTGVAAGTVTITYTYGGSYLTTSYTVSPVIAAITGTSSFCAGTTATFTDSTTGGTWSSVGPAFIGSATGIATATYGGTATIYYSDGPGCRITKTVTVNATDAGYIDYFPLLCAGTTYTAINDSIPGGTWSSSDPAVASINSTSGLITGIAAGTATITYTELGGICGSGFVTRDITVGSTTTAGTISGPTTTVVGAPITLSETVYGGAWSSGSPGIATVGSTGIVTGVSTGSAIITYTISGCGGTIYDVDTVTVTAFDGISGNVVFPGSLFSGYVTVWLINYNPSFNLLTVVDSTVVYCNRDSVYYEFGGVATDSFRIKAAALDTPGIGYIPTYHTSSFYWHDANVLYHTAGTASIHQNINMAFGTTTSGPGFVAGDVTTGANKGTSGTIPAQHVHICIMNATTSQIIQQTFTNASGHYSFSNLPVGQLYNVFPDSLNYITTQYSNISLTSANPSMSAASFGQHTLSRTITPATEGVNNVGNITSLAVFPNPTDGKLNIQWNEAISEQGNISIADVTGRIVFSNTITLNQGVGTKEIDLSRLTDGVYIVSIKCGSTIYTDKLQLLK